MQARLARGRMLCPLAFHIDRRLHLELAYKRQHQTELAIRKELEAGSRGNVWEVRDLSHLDAIHEAAGNSIVVVLAYSRSCGSCKMVMQEYQKLCTQAAWSLAGVVFCKHNVVNEFDHRSDVASMYKIRHVPSFYYFAHGALLDRSYMPDTRTIHRPSHVVERAMRNEMNQINDLIRRLVFRTAPSAQKP